MLLPEFMGRGGVDNPVDDLQVTEGSFGNPTWSDMFDSIHVNITARS
jgi:hypothetical protein